VSWKRTRPNTGTAAEGNSGNLTSSLHILDNVLTLKTTGPSETLASNSLHYTASHSETHSSAVLLPFVGRGETESSWYVGHLLAYSTSSSIWWNEHWYGKQVYWEKTCPSVALSTSSPKRSEMGSNPCRHGGKMATNRLTYGTACLMKW
jgi:hypothetical protein